MSDEISAINSQTGASGQSKAATAGATLATDFDQFLTLLTTQLANQDPLSPMDTTEFTNQLVLFAGVEQQIATNQNLEQLISLSGGNQAVQAVSFIGKQVEATGNIFQLTDKGATLGFNLLDDPQTATMLIFDEADNIVLLKSVEPEAGKQTFVWDGRDSNGNLLPQGAYSFSISAIDGNEANVDSTTSVRGIVDGVETRDDAVILTVGDTEMLLENVFGIRPAPVDEDA